MLHQYAAAGFNLVMGGNFAAGCQRNGTMPTPATADQALDCFMDQLPLIEQLGLRATFGIGFYDSNTGGLDEVGLMLY